MNVGSSYLYSVGAKLGKIFNARKNADVNFPMRSPKIRNIPLPEIKPPPM